MVFPAFDALVLGELDIKKPGARFKTWPGWWGFPRWQLGYALEDAVELPREKAKPVGVSIEKKPGGGPGWC